MNASTTLWFTKQLSDYLFADFSLSRLKVTLQILRCSLKNKSTINDLHNFSLQNSKNHELVNKNKLIKFFIVPYFTNSDDVATRFRLILNHHSTVDEMGKPLNLYDDEELIITSIPMRDGSELKLTIDRASWFLKEGQLVLNAIINGVRVYSIAFTLHLEGNSELICYIGAIQGRNLENIQSTYKNMTKSMHGLRPRDMMINALTLLCRKIKVKTLYAVTNECRHHNHSFFSEKVIVNDYDIIWQEKGGTISTDGCLYRLPLELNLKPISEIASKKRSMYKKRYQLLDDLGGAFSVIDDINPTKLIDDYQ